MKRLALWAGLGLALLGPGLSISNATITFSGLARPNSASFSSYTEEGFTVAASSGNWFRAFSFGNPTASIFANTTIAAVDITRPASATFTFAQVDLGDAVSGGTTYQVQGLLNNALVLTTSGVVGTAGFVTVASPDSGQLVDLLRITMSRSSGSYNIDNIGVTAATVVPEPATIALLVIAGLAAIGFGSRGRSG